MHNPISRSRVWSRHVVSAFVLAVLASPALACGSDDSSAKDASSSCKDLCTKSGFSGSRIDEQPNELNCFCSGGTSTVASADCTDMCKGLGKSSAQAFKSSNVPNPDSCQCS